MCTSKSHAAVGSPFGKEITPHNRYTTLFFELIRKLFLGEVPQYVVSVEGDKG